MARLLGLAALLVPALCLTMEADDKAPVGKVPVGNLKVVMQTPTFPTSPYWVVKFEEKDGAVSGKLVATAEDLPPSQVQSTSVKNGVLTCVIRVGDARAVIEAKLPAEEAAKMVGTITLPPQLLPRRIPEHLQTRGIYSVAFEKTALTSLSDTDIVKDILQTSTNQAMVVEAGRSLVAQAGFLKAKPEEVRVWMDKAIKASEAFGERFNREILLEMVQLLNEQDGMAATALPFARKAERMLGEKERPAVLKKTYEILATALERAGKGDEAKEIAAKLAKLDFTVATEVYPGRDKKFNRVAVFELFTGTECPPCVAADLGYDALIKTFKPSDVIMLQYHLHIPGPDPLTNEDAIERQKYYAEVHGQGVQGTPATLINGNPAARGGGPKAAAQAVYDRYYEAIVGKLDETAKVKLTGKAVRKGDKIDIDADVADLDGPGKSMRLRILLVEDVVEYKGGNGVAQHHHVVRAHVGDAKGVALEKKELKHKASVDVGDVKKNVTKYLTDFYKKNEEDLPKMLPLDLKKLKVVALVQDDNTRDILHAIQIDVEDAK